MKHIVIDGRKLSHTTGRYTRKLLDNLQDIDRTNKYTVLVNKEDEDFWKPRDSSDNFSRVTVKYRHYTINEQLGFAVFLYKLNADLVHFTMPQQPLLYFKPTISTIHDLIILNFKNYGKNKYSFLFKQFIFRFFVAYIAHKSKAVLTVSNFSKKSIVEYCRVKPDKVFTTYAAADMIPGKSTAFKPLLGKDFFFYVGNAHVHKNLPMLVKAMPEILITHPDLFLVFVGKESVHHKKLQEGVPKEIANRVIFTGFVDDSQLKWLYENALLYTFPSLMEGFGLPGLEAMQHGLAVSSSNSSCLPEIYGDAARYYDPKDSMSIAEAIIELVSFPDLRQKLIKQGRKRASKYSWSRMTQETHDSYMKSISG